MRLTGRWSEKLRIRRSVVRNKLTSQVSPDAVVKSRAKFSTQPMPMPLTPTIEREPLHTRSITIHGYRRTDGLYDIEGHLTDVKSLDMTLTAGVRKAGEAIHEMWLRITIDTRLNIVAAEAQSDAVPYPGHCSEITPHYGKLVGLSLRPGFTAKVRALFGSPRGCTHISELVGSVATAAYQTLAGQVKQPGEMKPFQLDKCHALMTDGPAVAKYYPRWYRGAETKAG